MEPRAPRAPPARAALRGARRQPAAGALHFLYLLLGALIAALLLLATLLLAHSGGG